MTQETPRLILPFCILSEDRIEPFLGEAEKAAVFCLAELERTKGGGVVIKQPEEKIDFIAKVAYPLRLAPFNQTDLVFDGLGMAAHTFAYSAVPDIQAFIENIERSSSSREAYMAFLSDNVNYFQISNEQEKTSIEGLVADANFLQDLSPYLSEARTLEASASSVAIIPAAVTEQALSSSLEELENLKSKLENEAKALDKSMKLLNLTTKDFVRVINAEVRQTKARFNEEIDKRRGPVDVEVREIQVRCDQEITLVSRRFERELLHLQREKVKREMKKDQLLRKIERSEVEIKTSSAKKDKVREKNWKEEREKRKKELSQIESEMKASEKAIKETEEKKSQELFKIRSECDAKIQEAKKEIAEIESSRDAKVQILKQEIDRMKEATSSIIMRMDEAAKSGESSMFWLGKLGIMQRDEKPTMLFVPFYLASFKSQSGKRYMVIPPSTVNNVKLSVKLKGVLGMAKIKQLLSPRSDAIAAHFSRFPSLMERSAVFEREVNEACSGVNILQPGSRGESLKNGLIKLRDEEWLSEKEYVSFVQRLT